jgi:hypothetical protein
MTHYASNRIETGLVLVLSSVVRKELTRRVSYRQTGGMQGLSECQRQAALRIVSVDKYRFLTRSMGIMD